MLLRINPDYEIARTNLSVVLCNYGVQQAMEGNFDLALSLFYHALAVRPSLEDSSSIKHNLAAGYTSLGIQAYKEGNLIQSLLHMQRACGSMSNKITRRNLSLAYIFLGNSKLKEGELQDAVTLFEVAEDTALVFPELYNNSGAALALLGRLDEAIERFHRALKLSPDDEIILHNLNLAEGGANVGFRTVDIKAEFYPAPPMQQQGYSEAA